MAVCRTALDEKPSAMTLEDERIFLALRTVTCGDFLPIHLDYQLPVVTRRIPSPDAIWSVYNECASSWPWFMDVYLNSGARAFPIPAVVVHG